MNGSSSTVNLESPVSFTGAATGDSGERREREEREREIERERKNPGRGRREGNKSLGPSFSTLSQSLHFFSSISLVCVSVTFPPSSLLLLPFRISHDDLHDPPHVLDTVRAFFEKKRSARAREREGSKLSTTSTLSLPVSSLVFFFYLSSSPAAFRHQDRRFYSKSLALTPRVFSPRAIHAAN